MKNYQIGPVQMPHLVRLTADLFRNINEEIDYSPVKAKHMHFVADLLKELVDTAYPIKEEKSPRPYIINIPITKNSKKMADMIMEATKMAKEQCYREGDF